MTLEEIRKHEGRFGVDSYPGIAFYFAGERTALSENYEYETITGFAIMVMVGDDREHAIDPEEVHPLDDDAYCHECGQIGCKADGR